MTDRNRSFLERMPRRQAWAFRGLLAWAILATLAAGLFYVVGEDSARSVSYWYDRWHDADWAARTANDEFARSIQFSEYLAKENDRLRQFIEGAGLESPARGPWPAVPTTTASVETNPTEAQP